MKSLTDYRKDDRYVADNGAEWDDIHTFVLEGLMGFCGCGMPEHVANLIEDGLQHIKDLMEIRDGNHNRPGSDPKWKEDWDGWNRRGLEIFGNPGCEYLLYYCFDNAGLTEHGGAVPGWLSDLGEDVLKEMKTQSTPEDSP